MMCVVDELIEREQEEYGEARDLFYTSTSFRISTL